MPRIPRGDSSEGIYHVINRGNMQMQVFDDAEDYEYFLDLVKKGADRERVAVHAYCLMPNHFHLLLSPKQEGSLSRMMQWVMTSHVRYYHCKNKTSGHVWQGRYKSFIVQKGGYYLNLIRYIEANALRAGMVQKAEDWRYGSLFDRLTKKRSKILCKPLMALVDDWAQFVNEPISEDEIDRMRNSVNRQAPLGDEKWQTKTAAKHGLASTLSSIGRPRKES
jgi:putative transposase